MAVLTDGTGAPKSIGQLGEVLYPRVHPKKINEDFDEGGGIGCVDLGHVGHLSQRAGVAFSARLCVWGARWTLNNVTPNLTVTFVFSAGSLWYSTGPSPCSPAMATLSLLPSAWCDSPTGSSSVYSPSGMAFS